MDSDYDRILSALAAMRTQLLVEYPDKLTATVTDPLECALELVQYQLNLCAQRDKLLAENKKLKDENLGLEYDIIELKAERCL